MTVHTTRNCPFLAVLPHNQKVIPMTTVIHCRDVGFDCDGVIRADTEEEALERAAQHARDAHDLEEVTPEVVEKVKAAMREESVGPE